jgi:predicted Rossmann fold flavoprotein
MNTYSIAIIGGGASGLVAANTAARCGATVTLFERNDRVGRKIPATGNGRCNLTNMVCSVRNFHGQDASFVKHALDVFPPSNVRKFFDSIGLLTVEEEQGRIYPVTGQASSVLDTLRFEAERLNVRIHTGKSIKRISRSKGLLTLYGDTEFTCDRCIVATGGMAAPHLGGTDLGLNLLRHAGHPIINPCPALVPLTTSSRFGKQLKGVRIHAKARLVLEGVNISEEGEILFTEYGLSGIPIIQLSIDASRELTEKKTVSVHLDLFPSMPLDQLILHVQDRFAANKRSPVEQLLTGLIHKRLIPCICREAGISNMKIPAESLAPSSSRRIAEILKSWEFHITGTRSWNDAQVMSGGADTGEFNPVTMESSCVKGLYACGEVLDIAGDCGGYNLQWAWASGYLAGCCASGHDPC